MKKIVCLFFLLCFTLFSKAQDTIVLCGYSASYTVDRISCYNDSGFINITYINNPPTTYSYEWYDTDWNSTNIFTVDLAITICQEYHLVVSDNGGVCDTFHQWIGCPPTLGNGYVTPACVGDTGTLKGSNSCCGIPFDPDGISETGDEYYVYTWYSADDNLGTNSMLLPDTVENLVGIQAGWYINVMTDADGCTDSIIRQLSDPAPLIFDTIVYTPILCHGDSTILELQVTGGTQIDSLGLGYFYYIIQNTDDTISSADLSASDSNFTALASSPSIYIPDTVLIVLYASTDSFQIVVVDSMGCILDTTIFISQPDSIVASILPLPPNMLICSYDSTLISLNSITGGTFPYTSYWNNNPILTNDSIYVNG
ncbi:MAG: hypothetical protein ACKVJA_03640, partial [Flavobacteriales bacterium]